MSASKDKIRRQQEKESGAYQEKLGKAQEKEKADKKFRLITRIVVACVVVFALVVILFSSGMLYKTFTAAEIGDSRFTVSDVNYYYQTIYNNYYSEYYSSYGEYASYFVPERDDLMEETLETMQEVTMLCSEAKRNGFEMSEEDLATVEQEMASVESAAAGYGVSVSNYLTTAYGKGMTLKNFRKNVEQYVLATAYGESIRESYTYTAEEISDYYEEHRDAFDIITARVFMIAADKNEAGEYDLNQSNAKAEEFLSKVTDEQSFIDLAYEYAVDSNKEAYEDEDATLSKMQGSRLNSTYSEWMLDAARKTGDTTYVQAASGTYVLYFVSRDNNDYNTIDVRHILVQFDSTDENGVADEETKDAAYEEAERIYQEWKDGEETEESFAALADEYSDDSPAGGLYEHVFKDQMVQPFNDWCFSASRQEGDTAIVETEYGYHVMYFVGTDDKYNDYLAETEMRSKAFSEWEDELAENYSVQKTWLIGLAGK